MTQAQPALKRWSLCGPIRQVKVLAKVISLWSKVIISQYLGPIIKDVQLDLQFEINLVINVYLSSIQSKFYLTTQLIFTF